MEAVLFPSKGHTHLVSPNENPVSTYPLLNPMPSPFCVHIVYLHIAFTASRCEDDSYERKRVMKGREL